MAAPFSACADGSDPCSRGRTSSTPSIPSPKNPVETDGFNPAVYYRLYRSTRLGSNNALLVRRAPAGFGGHGEPPGAVLCLRPADCNRLPWNDLFREFHIVSRDSAVEFAATVWIRVLRP